jgi:uncharacterized membrane protein YedE/YeeE
MNHLLAQGLLDSPIGWLLSLAIGALFGFWLERAGFGSSRKLTAIFYFEDFAVLKVMFSAMATAGLVLAVLASLGKVDLHSFFVPATVLWPQAIGGLVFGAGFVVGGWCPGTAAVGLASGKIDALTFLVGAGLGSVAFAFLAPSMTGFLAAGNCGDCVLTELVGISPVVGAVALLAIALGSFVVAEKVESIKRRMS